MGCPGRRKKAKMKRCVKRVRKKGGVKSPYAVCRASVYKKKR
jgi:hypothetical protein